VDDRGAGPRSRVWNNELAVDHRVEQLLRPLILARVVEWDSRAHTMGVIPGGSFITCIGADASSTDASELWPRPHQNAAQSFSSREFADKSKRSSSETGRATMVVVDLCSFSAHRRVSVRLDQALHRSKNPFATFI
jgi:hypothetical protein